MPTKSIFQAFCSFGCCRSPKQDVSASRKSALDIEKERIGGARYKKRPWLSPDGKVIWSRNRIRVARFIGGKRFEMFMGCVILFNVGPIVIEADTYAQCFPEYKGRISECPYVVEEWVGQANNLALIMFTIEAVALLYADRCTYFLSKWNLMDFLIVTGGWLVESVLLFLPDVLFLRIVRILRLVRASRLLAHIPELYLVLNGLLSSFKAIMFGSLLLFTALICWSIILVQYAHPINASIVYKDCSRCSHAFSTILDSTLTLFQQIVTGDSWGVTSIPIIQKEPILSILFITITVTISLGVMNLILAVIVQRAAEVREQNLEEEAEEKREDAIDEKNQILALCADVDSDGSGMLSFEELERAYAEIGLFRDRMENLSAEKCDMEIICKVLDPDDSGSVSYHEFVDMIYNLEEVNSNVEAAEVKQHLVELERVIAKANLMTTQHTEMLVKQTESLAFIEKTLDHLLTEAEPPNPAAACKKSPPRHGATPLPVLLADTTEADLANEMVRLRRRIADLSAEREGIREEVDSQAQEFSRSAELLASAAKVPVPREVCDRVGEVVSDIRDVVQEFPVVLQALKRRVDQEGAVLAVEEQTLDAIEGFMSLDA